MKTSEVTPYLQIGHSVLVCTYNVWITYVGMYNLHIWRDFRYFHVPDDGITAFRNA
jgi:hypothetical protein